MIKNYLHLALRNFRKHKAFTLINLLGLSIGLSVCYFAWTYVQFELSYDSYHAKADRIYRLVTDVKTSKGIDYQSTSAPMAPALEETFPEVESATRLLLDYLLVQQRQHNFSEEKVAYADSSLFSVFTFPFLIGNPQQALNAPFTIVLTETTAHKYFGSNDCLGKTLLIDGKHAATVTGVMQDIPANSHFRVDMLVSMSTLLQEWNPSMADNWKRFGFYTYLLLANDYAPAHLAEKLPSFVGEHMPQDQIGYSLSLEPLKSVYLQAKPRGHRAGSSVSGNKKNLYTFTLVALFVLFIASFNFVNLSTAVSMQRSREVGVRKVLGASRKELITQFLTDAVLLSLTAFFLSLLLCMIFLPIFNQLSGKIINNSIFEPINYLGLLFLLALVLGLLSGLYPALFLSGFQPLSSLKGKLVSGSQGTLLRKTLVTCQFFVSVVLIMATLVIYHQLHFMQNQELGFHKRHKLVIDFHFDEQVKDRIETIKQELLRIPGIESATVSSSLPGRANHQLITSLENADHEEYELRLDAYFVDRDFLEQYQIEVIAGQAFSDITAPNSKQAMMINASAAKILGYVNPADAVGKSFRQGEQEGTIIGVVNDFHFHSFQKEIQPLTLRNSPGFLTFLTVQLSPERLRSTLVNLEHKWADLADIPFSYFFADEAYDALYKAEEHFGKLFVCFATLAVLISCLGLLGLSAFGTAQRTQEIGLRKVLGATVGSILFLLSKDYIKLILIACIIALPIANYFITDWLQSFAYRVDISWWWFVLPTLIILFIAFLSISGQTFKAAKQNPVDSLRYE